MTSSCPTEKENQNNWSDLELEEGETTLLWSDEETQPPGDEGVKTPVSVPALPSVQPEVPKKKVVFRMNCKNFFLTFPQCQTTKEVALDRLKVKFPSGKFLVCHENHMSGDDHLHCLVQLDASLHIRDPRYFDFVGDQHGKYEPARNIRKSVEYITKKGDYVSHGIDVESILNKSAPKSGKIAQMLSDGRSLSEIDNEDKGFFMMNKRKVEEYESWVSQKKARDNLQPWVEFTEAQIEGMNSSSKQIALWLNKNIKKKRPFKQAQLYIHGPKNMGKTTLITWLKNFVTVYSMPKSEEFYDLYEDAFYDLIVMDEFQAQKKVTDLNEWLQGSEMNVRKKGRQGLKKENLPFIILSNYSLENAYKNCSEYTLDLLRCRLEFVEIESQLNLFTI